MTEAVETSKPKNPAYRVWRDVAPEVRHERLQAVMHRIVNDERLADIAQDLGMSRSGLNMALLEYAEDDWKRAQTARAMTRLDRANDALESAADTLTLARAREELRSAQWELERLLRRLYGQDSPPNAAAIQINIGIARQQTHEIPQPAPQVIDIPVNAADCKSVA